MKVRYKNKHLLTNSQISLIRDCISWFYHTKMKPHDIKLEVKIIDEKDWDKPKWHASFYCEHYVIDNIICKPDNIGYIEIRNLNLEPETLSRVLIHELIHFEQFVSGRHGRRGIANRTNIFFRKMNEDEAKFYPDNMPYREQPWEIEAYSLEPKYVSEYWESVYEKSLDKRTFYDTIRSLIQNMFKKLESISPF